MTIQLPDLREPALEAEPASARSLSWLSPASGLWVATVRGEHAGMVTRVDGAYHATDGRGRDLGRFPELTDAFERGDRVPGEAHRGVRSVLWALNLAAAAAVAALVIAVVR